MSKYGVLAACALALFGASSTQATIVYSGTVITNACGSRTERLGIGLYQQDFGSAAPGLGCSALGQNDAAAGQLKLRAVSNVSGAAAYGQSQTDVQAGFNVDDLIINGPQGVATASGRIRLRVDGLLGASTDAAGSQPLANSTALWLLRIDSTFGQGQTSLARYSQILNEDGDVRTEISAEGSSGVLTGYQGGTTFIDLLLVNVPANVPLGFSLSVRGQARVTAAGCVSDPLCNAWTAGATGELNYLSTVSFAESEAAFVFDEGGFSANSESLNVVDNYWLGVPAVPEPATYSMLLGGLGILAWGFKRR